MADAAGFEHVDVGALVKKEVRGKWKKAMGNSSFLHQRRRRRRQRRREGAWKNPFFLFLFLSLSLSLSLSRARAPAHSHLLFSLEPPFHTLQGLHSGSDEKYDALIIDEDKVRF
jgi:hypothetical protein